MDGAHAAVDMQDLARDERGGLQVDHRVDDVANLAHPADRLQGGEDRGLPS